MYKLGDKLFTDNKQGATQIKCPACNGSGMKKSVAEGEELINLEPHLKGLEDEFNKFTKQHDEELLIGKQVELTTLKGRVVQGILDRVNPDSYVLKVAGTTGHQHGLGDKPSGNILAIKKDRVKSMTPVLDEAKEFGERDMQLWAARSPENQKLYDAYKRVNQLAKHAWENKDGAEYTGLQVRRTQIRDLIGQKMFGDEGVMEDLPPPENARKTQIAGTLPTYKKAADILNKTGVQGKALDFGAGLGMGTGELGKDAHSYEPFPGEKFKPHFVDVTKIPDNSYHKIVNLNVLNVVPNVGEHKIRDSIVKNIGRVLAPGGVALITTRGKDVLTIKGTPGEEPMSMISKIGTYQKGFSQTELKQYIQSVLGDGFEVSSIKLGPAGVMIKKLDQEGVEEGYQGKGNHRPGWMLRADPELAKKVKTNTAKAKAKARALGNPAAGTSTEQDVKEAGYGPNRGYAHGFASPTSPALRGRGREDDEGNSEFDDKMRALTGMIFYNNVDNPEEAIALGLKQTRTGKWFLRTGNRFAQKVADQRFGPGKVWYPKNESIAEEGEPKQVDMKRWMRDFDRREDKNFHTENMVAIAKLVGTPEEIKMANEIKKEHMKQGHISHELYTLRQVMYKKLWPLVVEKLKAQGLAEDWQKTNKSDKTDGMSDKAVKAYRRENPGSKLQTAVTTKPSKLKAGSKDAKRRKSFCARMSGNKGPMKDEKGRPTPKAKALKRWNCNESRDMCNVCGQTPCNCTSASNILKGIRG
jgi:SAM-dependent methyltransferase